MPARAPERQGEMNHAATTWRNPPALKSQITASGPKAVMAMPSTEPTTECVVDTGIGIPETMQELVFEPFETILEDKDDPRLGFGIGLKIVEHIIDLHDGETWFESVEGRGSSFFFTIPWN